MSLRAIARPARRSVACLVRTQPRENSRSTKSIRAKCRWRRIANPRSFLRFLGPELQRRAIAAELDLPCELGLQIGADKYQLSVSRRGVKITRSKLGRSYVRMNRAEFTRLAFGHMDVAEAAAQDRVQSLDSAGDGNRPGTLPAAAAMAVALG